MSTLIPWNVSRPTGNTELQRRHYSHQEIEISKPLLDLQWLANRRSSKTEQFKFALLLRVQEFKFIETCTDCLFDAEGSSGPDIPTTSEGICL